MGLPNLGTFMALLHFLVPLVTDQRKILTLFQMPLLTFMCLRLDLPAHLNPAQRQCAERSIVWPDRDTLHKTMPHQFVEAFGRTGSDYWLF